MNPIDRPNTNKPLRVPIYVSHYVRTFVSLTERRSTNLDIFIRLLWGEGTTIAEKIDKTHSDTTIDVQDKLRYG